MNRRRAAPVQVEHVEGRRVFHVLGVDHDDALCQRVARREQIEHLNLLQHLALAVDDDQGRRLLAAQILNDEPLE